jgi:AMP phosphorylase
MKFKVKILGIDAGDKHIAVVNDEDAAELGAHSLDRISIQTKEKELISTMNTTKASVPKGFLGVFARVVSELSLKEGSDVEVSLAQPPTSLNAIKLKMKNHKMTYDDANLIVNDVVSGRLSEIEITSFVTTLNNFGLDIDETVSMAENMVGCGKCLDLKAPYIVDKHSIGGVPGDKTTLLVVPIIAACGVTIPKTSSRAITSAAGTADRAEVLMPVSLNLDDMRTVVKRTNGCIIWGGALDLSPADDIFIKSEHPLSIDPLMIPSIMSKKKAVGAQYLVIDIPTGQGAKMKTMEDAEMLAREMIEVGRRLGIKTQCAITFGEQPLGHAIGSGPEAREALEVIMRKKTVPDVYDKAKSVAAMILDMIGKDGPKLVDEVFKSGKVEEKLRQIIFEQGGDSQIKPEDIEYGKYGLDYHAEKSGNVLVIDNHQLASAARAAGSPKDHGAGIYLYKKMGEKVEKGEKLFTVYAEKPRKLKLAKEKLDESPALYLGEHRDMLLRKVIETTIMGKPAIIDR